MSQCFKTSDLAALKASLLYDDNHDDGSLWVRPSPGPLPVCSSHHPSGSSCFVCLWDQVVFAVCRNLLDSAKIMMEGHGRPIDLEKTACPQLITEGPQLITEGPQLITEGGWNWWLPLIILAVVVVVVLAVVRWKRNKRPNAGRQPQDGPAVEHPINESPV